MFYEKKKQTKCNLTIVILRKTFSFELERSVSFLKGRVSCFKIQKMVQKTMLIVLAAFLGVLIILIGVLVTNFKIGVVNNQRLISEYKVTKNAEIVIKQKVELWGLTLDSLRRELDALEYERSLPQRLKDERANYLQREIGIYEKTITEQAYIEAERMHTGSVNQLQAKVKSYAEHQGYWIILGSNGFDNILFAHPFVDITDDVLKYVNQ